MTTNWTNYPHEFPKIHTLWKRNEKTHKIIEGNFSKPEFDAVKLWHVTEKIDGMNIRVTWDCYTGELCRGRVHFAGKTNDAQIPAELLKHLQETFTDEKMKEQFKESQEVVLFGEGYGAGIQSGGKYSDTQKFILFDAWIDGWWLNPDRVEHLADELGCDYVPVFEIETTLEKAIEMAKISHKSFLYPGCEAQMEGIVVRSVPTMLFRNGEPIMFKLKWRDFQ